MSKNGIIQEYNEEMKVGIIIENIALMLSRRRDAKGTFKEYSEQFKSNLTSNTTTFNKGDNMVKIVVTFDKVKKIDRFEEDNLFTNNPNEYIIYVVQCASPKIIKMFDCASNSEIVFVSEVLADRMDHVTQPNVILLSEEEQQMIKDEYHATEHNLQKIRHGTDALARYYQLKKGEIVEFNSASECSGISVRYRICY